MNKISVDVNYLKDVLAVLNEVEFAGDDIDPEYDWNIIDNHYTCCPICKKEWDYTNAAHEDNCKLNMLIEKTEGILNEL
jgi:hypothetical protein